MYMVSFEFNLVPAFVHEWYSWYPFWIVKKDTVIKENDTIGILYTSPSAWRQKALAWH